MTFKITDTHRCTYMQNAVTGTAKNIIQAYWCDPAYYSTALIELMSNFGDPAIDERLHKSIGNMEIN